MPGPTLSLKNILRYFDIFYFTRFLLLLLTLYYFNIFYLGITDPKNFYLPFFDMHLNYISWLTTSILKTADVIDHMFGLPSSVSGHNISVPHGANVFLEYACLGFGIMSFWIAFVVADKNDWKKKFIWCFSGLVIIWFINCWRIAILVLALQNKWPGNTYIDHHDIFNIVAYSLILLLIYLYNRQNKEAVLQAAIKNKQLNNIIVI